jgi:hypothetical protein
MSSDSNIDYSIIVPVYYNEGSLRGLWAAIWNDVIQVNPDLNGEVIFVDDGSGDGSFTQLRALQRENPSFVRIIKLTRNFGSMRRIHFGRRAGSTEFGKPNVEGLFQRRLRDRGVRATGT